MITVRKVTPDDMPTLKQWAERRGCMLHEPLLSPHGFVAVDANDKPLICAWAAMVLDVPIIQVDHVYVPRRFKAEEVREAWAALIAFIQNWMRIINDMGGLGYNTLEIMMNPVMEGEVIRHGGHVSVATYKKAHYLIHHGS